jgi:hypothetical protein
VTTPILIGSAAKADAVIAVVVSRLATMSVALITASFLPMVDFTATLCRRRLTSRTVTSLTRHYAGAPPADGPMQKINFRSFL